MTPRRHDRTTVDLHPAPGEPAVLTLDPEALDAYRGGVRSRIEPGDTVLLFEGWSQQTDKNYAPVDTVPMTVALVLDPAFVAAYREGRP